MTPATATDVQYWDTDPHHHEEGASTTIGFWIYLMSDCLMFAVLFACLLYTSPSPRD